MIVPTVIAVLKDSEAVTAAVGNNIFPVMMPQGVEREACIIVWIGGNEPTNTNLNTPIDDINFMLHVDGKTYAALDGLAISIRNALEAYSGEVVQKIRYVTENDNDFDTENRMFSRAMVFNVRRKHG